MRSKYNDLLKYHVLGCALIQLPDLLLCIYNRMKKLVSVEGEYDKHEMPQTEMNNEMVIFTKTHTPRVEELERKVNELLTWKKDALQDSLKSKRP